MNHAESILPTACFEPSEAVWNPTRVTVCPETWVFEAKLPLDGAGEGEGDGDGDGDGAGAGEADVPEPVPELAATSTLKGSRGVWRVACFECCFVWCEPVAPWDAGD